MTLAVFPPLLGYQKLAGVSEILKTTHTHTVYYIWQAHRAADLFLSFFFCPSGRVELVSHKYIDYSLRTVIHNSSCIFAVNEQSGRKGLCYALVHYGKYTCCLVAVSSAFQFSMPAPWKWLFDSRQCTNPFVFVKVNVAGSSLFALCRAFGFLSWSIVCIIHCIHTVGEHKQSQTT